jgi:hypothetical protein
MADFFTSVADVSVSGAFLTNSELRASPVSVSIASAIAITDNASSLTVDAPVGTPVFVRLSDGSSAITTLPVSGSFLTDTQLRATAVPVSGTFWQATQPVSIASAVAVTDNSGSLTVDAPVATPVFVRLSDGAAAITTLPVSLASIPTPSAFNTTFPSGGIAIGINNGNLVSVSTPSVTGDGNAGANMLTTGLWGYNGATWDRLRTDTTNGLWVNVKTSASIAVTGTFWQTTQPVSLASVPSHAVTNAGTFAVQAASTIADAANIVEGALADAAVTAGASGSISAKLRSISRDIVANIVLAAGSNLIGRTVADASAATGGIPSTARLLSAAGTSGDTTNVKASAGRIYAIQGANVATSARYLKLYNSASAPTAGSGTPVKTLYLPPSSAFAFDWPLGLTFATGIGYTLVTGSADNSSTSVTAADILALNIDYA